MAPSGWPTRTGTPALVARYDDVNGLWTIPLPGESNQNWVNALTVAPDGDVWISDGMRILHFDGEWESVEGAGLDLSMVSTLSVDPDGTLWAAPMRIGDLVRGTGAGIARRVGSTWEAFDVTEGLVGPDGDPPAGLRPGDVRTGRLRLHLGGAVPARCGLDPRRTGARAAARNHGSSAS